MPWARPAEVPVGQVWSRFMGKERDGVPAKMYQIRDFEQKDRKKCLDLMKETFLRDEPLCQTLDIRIDPVSVSTIVSNWEAYIFQQVSLACYVEDHGKPAELVGFNVLGVRSRDDPQEDFEQIKGESWKKILKTLLVAEELVNIFEHYGVDKHMTTSGLTVAVEHRGQNIGARIIDARELLCRALGIEAVSTVFTARPSQILAAKCEYELLGILPYSDMKKYGVDLTGCTTPYAELRGKSFK